MKKYYILSLFLTFGFLSFSQDYVYDRLISSTGSGFDRVSDMSVSENGEVYIVGTFRKDITLGGDILNSYGKDDIFTTKYNADGSLAWTKQIGGSGNEYSHSITTDNENNIYVSGTFSEICSFSGADYTAVDFQDNFIIKLDQNGNYIWSEHIKADTKSEHTYLTCDNDNNVYLAGSFYKKAVIGTKTLNSVSNSDIFIAKYDKDGNYVNAVSFEGNDKDIINDITCSPEGDVFITGSFKEDLILGSTTLTSNGKEDIFLARINNMTPVWSKQRGSLLSDYGKCIQIYNNHIYLAGNFRSDISMGSFNLSSTGLFDAFLSKYNLSGTEQWAKGIGGKGNDYAHSFTVSNKGNIYLNGNFRDEISCNETLIKSQDFNNDIFTIKLNKNGEFSSLIKTGGKNNNFPVNIGIDEENNIYFSGNFDNEIKFDETLSESPTGKNIFLAKFYDCDNSDKINLGDDLEICGGSSITLDAGSAYSSYKWNDKEGDSRLTVNSGGTYTIEVTDQNGCVSTDDVYVNVVPELTVNLGDDQMICPGTSLVLDAGSSYYSYKWSGTEGISSQLIVNTEGTYTVEVGDQKGCSATDEINITIAPLLKVNLGPDQIICPGSSVTLDAGSEYSVYKWNGNEGNSQLSVNSEGTFTVEVTDQNGCISSDEIVISEQLTQSVDLGPDQTICPGSNFTLDAGSGYSVYKWNGNEGNSQLAVNSGETYTVEVTDQNGCISTDEIVISEQIVQSVDLGPDKTICQGTLGVVLEADPDFVTYKWNGTEGYALYPANTPGTYIVEATDENGCVSTDKIVISDQLAQSVDLGPDLVIENCQSGVTLDAGPNFVTYKWNGTLGSSQHLVNSGGTYTVKVTDHSGCISSDEIIVTESASVSVDLGPDLSVTNESKISLDAGPGFKSYKWYEYTIGINSYQELGYRQNLSVSGSHYTTSRTIYVKVTDSNRCQGEDNITINNLSAPSVKSNKINKELKVEEIIPDEYNIYPNPTNGKFYITVSDPSKVKQLGLYDIKGRLIKTYKDMLKFPMTIDLSGKAKGMYLLRVSEDNNVHQFKIIYQ